MLNFVEVKFNIVRIKCSGHDLGQIVCYASICSVVAAVVVVSVGEMSG